jgi:hypothetical protein
VSIDELWPEVDELDEANSRDTSMAMAQNLRRDQAPHSHSSCHEMGLTGADSLPKARRVLSSLYVPPREPGRGSTKNKAA